MTNDEKGEKVNPDDCETSSRQGKPLALDVVLDVLSNDRRRALLAFVQDAPDQVCSFESAASHVTRAVMGDESAPTSTSIRLELVHYHVPTLVDAGLLEFDAQSQTIRYTGGDRVEAILEAVRPFELE